MTLLLIVSVLLFAQMFIWTVRFTLIYINHFSNTIGMCMEIASNDACADLVKEGYNNG